MKPNERMAIPLQMPKELDPAERIKNFNEVTFGYDEETANQLSLNKLEKGDQ